MVQHSRAHQEIPAKAQIVSEIVVVVVGRSYGRGEIEVVCIEETLFAAVVREEELVFFCHIFVDTKTGLGCYYVVENTWVQVVLRDPRRAVDGAALEVGPG